MKGINNEKIIFNTVIFCVILCGVWGVNRYIDSLQHTIQQLKDTNIQSEQREQKLIRDVQLAKDETNTIYKRYNIVTKNYNRAINTVAELRNDNKRLQDINTKSEREINNLKSNNKQLSNTITELSARLNQTSTDFDEFRKGLERQSGYINELSKTIKEIEENNRMEEK